MIAGSHKCHEEEYSRILEWRGVEGWAHYLNLRWSGLERPLWGGDIGGLNNVKDLSMWKPKEEQSRWRAQQVQTSWSRSDLSMMEKATVLECQKGDKTGGRWGWREPWSLVHMRRSLDFIQWRKAIGGFQAEKCCDLVYVLKRALWLFCQE